MSTTSSDQGDFARDGSLTLDRRSWSWRARRRPDEEGNGAPSPILEWWEVHFRLEADSEQEARVRAGVPEGEWSDEVVRSVLRSARERTWRDDDGRLWKVRLEGWTGQGISTDVAEGEEEGAPTVVFSAVEGSERVRRPAGDLSSLTAPDDEVLQDVLEGREPVPGGD